MLSAVMPSVVASFEGPFFAFAKKVRVQLLKGKSRSWIETLDDSLSHLYTNKIRL
jgi:hypothetical protein